jgi:hypothetical protein
MAARFLLKVALYEAFSAPPAIAFVADPVV